MSVLTKNQILKEIKKGNIKIEPFDEKQIGPGSVDLTLGHQFRVFERQDEVVAVKEETDFKKITREVTVRQDNPPAFKTWRDGFRSNPGKNHSFTRSLWLA